MGLVSMFWCWLIVFVMSELTALELLPELAALGEAMLVNPEFADSSANSLGTI